MVKVYANLILAGAKTIEDVPERLRLAVETLVAQMLENNGH